MVNLVCPDGTTGDKPLPAQLTQPHPAPSVTRLNTRAVGDEDEPLILPIFRHFRRSQCGKHFLSLR